MYPSSSRELAVHAGILALILWTAVLADIAGPGSVGRYSHLPKGNDFLVFYVSGRLAAHRRFDVLVDDAQFRAAQQPFLGTESTVSYPAVYPPQVALAFAPLSQLPYTAAYFVWVLVTFGLVGAAIVEFDRDGGLLRAHPVLAPLLVLAFPPFPYLILAGQASAVALGALAVLHRGLARNTPWIAGMGVGLLAYKISIFVPALAVSLLAGEWTICAVAIAFAALQTLCVVPAAGIDVVLLSLHNILSAARHPDALATRPYLMVSWRTFWALLATTRWTLILYAVTAGCTVILTASAWRRLRVPLVRVSLLSLATALAAPHLFLYDTMIILPGLILAARRLLQRSDSLLLWVTITVFLSTLTIPAVAWLHVQFSTLALCGFWLLLQRKQHPGHASIAPSPAGSNQEPL